MIHSEAETVQEIRDACGVLAQHAELIGQHTNPTSTILALARRYAALAPDAPARTMAAPASPAPASPASAPTTSPAPLSWPDAAAIYAARRRDVERAGRTRRALAAAMPEYKPEPSPDEPAPASGDLGLDPSAIYARRRAEAAAHAGRR
jgi:hypothetical protein